MKCKITIIFMMLFGACESIQTQKKQYEEIVALSVMELNKAYGGFGVVKFSVVNNLDNGLCIPSTILSKKPTNHVGLDVRDNNKRAVDYPNIGYLLPESLDSYYLRSGETQYIEIDFNGLYNAQLSRKKTYSFKVRIPAEYCVDATKPFGSPDLQLVSNYTPFK